MSEEIEAWKERCLRRVDIMGRSVWVYGEQAKHHIERVQNELTRLKLENFKLRRDQDG